MKRRSEHSSSVALVLSSGGARGLAHIGVIQDLVARGYRIRSIAGSSMGAVVGGLYAVGKLEEYENWIRGFDKLDILRMIDFTPPFPTKGSSKENGFSNRCVNWI